MAKQLTKNFNSREFDCSDGSPVPHRDYEGVEALCRQMLEPLAPQVRPVLGPFRLPDRVP